MLLQLRTARSHWWGRAVLPAAHALLALGLNPSVPTARPPRPPAIYTQGSQEALVPLAAKYGEALPYESSDIGARLELEAAQQKLQAAEEQLQHLRQRLLERQPGGGGGEQQAPAQHAGDAAGGGG